MSRHRMALHGIACHRMSIRNTAVECAFVEAGPWNTGWNRKQESWESRDSTSKKRWKRTLCSHDSRIGASSRTTLLRVSESVIMMPKGTESVGANSSSHSKGHLHHCSRFSSVLKEETGGEMDPKSSGWENLPSRQLYFWTRFNLRFTFAFACLQARRASMNFTTYPSALCNKQLPSSSFFTYWHRSQE